MILRLATVLGVAIMGGYLGAEQDRGAKDYCFCAAFSPDGKMLVLGSSEGRLKLMSYPEKRDLWNLAGHKSTVTSVLFSGNRRIVTASYDRTVKLWDAATGKLEVSIDVPFSICSADIAPDGKSAVVSGPKGGLAVVTLGEPRAVILLEGHFGEVASAAFSSDSKTIVSGGFDTEIMIWDATMGTMKGKAQRHCGSVTNVCFSNNGTLFASGDDEGVVAIRDLNGPLPLDGFATDRKAIRAMSFSPDDRYLAIGTEEGILLEWDIEEREVKAWTKAHEREILALAYSPDGSVLFTAGPDGKMKLSKARLKVGGRNRPEW